MDLCVYTSTTPTHLVFMRDGHQMNRVIGFRQLDVESQDVALTVGGAVQFQVTLVALAALPRSPRVTELVKTARGLQITWSGDGQWLMVTSLHHN